MCLNAIYAHLKEFRFQDDSVVDCGINVTRTRYLNKTLRWNVERTHNFLFKENLFEVKSHGIAIFFFFAFFRSSFIECVMLATVLHMSVSLKYALRAHFTWREQKKKNTKTNGEK